MARAPLPSGSDLESLRAGQLGTAEDQGKLAAEIAKIRRCFDLHRVEDRRTFVRLEKNLNRVTGLVLAGIGAIISSGLEGKVGIGTGSTTALLVLVAILYPERLAKLAERTPIGRVLDDEPEPGNGASK